MNSLTVRIIPVVASALLLAGGDMLAERQQPRAIELDATTLAERAKAARSLVPLLEDVKRRARSGMAVTPGNVPDSPFTGTQTTLLAFTIGKNRAAADPSVVKAMDQLLAWTPGDRSAAAESALFDEWLDQLSLKATAVNLKKNLVACDTDCVVQTMTRLDDSWGGSPRERAELRDMTLLEALTDAVKNVK
jgi:hypothetical protein